jgi:hypothetical protein
MPSWPRASPRIDSLCRLRVALALLCVSGLAGPPELAWGDARDALRTVVMARRVDSPLARRLGAELTAQGFVTIPYAPAGGPVLTTDTIESVERANDARAVLRIDEAARVIEVWLSPANGGGATLVDTVPWEPTIAGEGIAAVHAAESLHAALVRIESPLSSATPAAEGGSPPLEAGVALPAPAPAPEPTNAVPLVSTPTPRPARAEGPSPTPVHSSAPLPTQEVARFAFAAGIAVLGAPGGLGAMSDVSLAARWHPFRAWSVGVFGQIPVLSASVTRAPEGTAHVEPAIFGGELILDALDRRPWRLHPDLALGGGVVWLHSSGEGTATAPFLGVSSDVWMAVVQARAGLGLSLTDAWRIRADATVGITMPEGAVTFVDSSQIVATWGRPILMGSVALEFLR